MEARILPDTPAAPTAISKLATWCRLSSHVQRKNIPDGTTHRCRYAMLCAERHHSTGKPLDLQWPTGLEIVMQR